MLHPSRSNAGEPVVHHYAPVTCSGNAVRSVCLHSLLVNLTCLLHIVYHKFWYLMQEFLVQSHACIAAAAALVHAGMTVTLATVFQPRLCIVVAMSTQSKEV